MRRDEHEVVVIGAGLAGPEAAWQAAERGASVLLYEMRPGRGTAAHQTDLMAELVCSNSLGSNLPDRALGVLKQELRRLGSLVIRVADEHAVPAGGALAVDRDAFSAGVTAAIEGHPRITVVREEVTELPEGRPVVVATGPLTSAPLAEVIKRLAGDETLYFFDAMAPIVSGETVDMNVAFRQSRYAKPLPGDGSGGEPQGDYINCPLTEDEYFAFVQAVNDAEKINLREFETLQMQGDDEARRYFEGCLPIEVLAARDPMALAFGPMRPVGLRDPRTGRRPFAAVQLRQDNAAGTLYNLVGFQTNIKWGDQERVLRMIPGLAQAEFVRFGQMHRNTFINSPRLLRPTLQWRGRADGDGERDDLFFAGQLTGTEGYVGSTASGLVAGLNAWARLRGLPLLELPPTSMLGALLHYITHADPAGFQPMKANFGLMPELDPPVRDKRKRYAAYAERALADLETAIAERPWLNGGAADR